MKILCSGDIHIGRRPSYSLEAADGRQHSAAEAWKRIVDVAIDRSVDVVALTGDTVDRANRFAEAYGPLERGVVALSRAGIHTCAVAGNHDFDVFPHLAKNLSGELFHFLGAEGEWERFTLEDNGRPVLHIDGWSFPSQYIHESPLDNYRLSHDGDVPVVGILHTALDAAGSRYAPVMTSELERCPVSIWLLGHVHTAMVKDEPGSPTIVYPGSPQALSRREGGVHGACLIEIGGAGEISTQMIPLASLQYDEIEVGIEGIQCADDFRSTLIQSVRQHLDGDSITPGLRHVVCSLQFTGRTALHREVRALAEEMKDDLSVPSGDLTASIEKVVVNTLPDRDLESIAGSGGKDTATYLAGILLSLENETPGDELDQLVKNAIQALADVDRSPLYMEVDLADGTAADERARTAVRLLREQGMMLLDTLLSQAGETR